MTYICTQRWDEKKIQSKSVTDTKVGWRKWPGLPSSCGGARETRRDKDACVGSLPPGRNFNDPVQW